MADLRSLPSSLVRNTTWKVSAPFGGTNPHFFVPERKQGYFESLAPQDFQNNLPGRVENRWARDSCLRKEKTCLFANEIA